MKELYQAVKTPTFIRWIQEGRYHKLNGQRWVNVLVNHPQFADECDWDTLNSRDWSRLLQYQPQFKNHPMYKLKAL